LRALADSPDAFGSTLAREQVFPDTDWSARLASRTESLDLPLVAELGAEPVGLAWARIDSAEPERARLYQMWVAPNVRRLGVGGMLVQAAIAWARAADARSVALSVTCGAAPAERLYAAAGFEPIGAPEPIRPGSSLLVQPMLLELRRGRS
jgi:GNAT superfamily N-acetyltransferase